MAAGNIIVRRRNGADTGWEEVEVDVSVGQPLRANYSKNITAGDPPQGTPTTLSTAGAGTYLAAAILSGMILRDPNGLGRTDSTDTAANLIAAIPALGVNYGEHYFYVVNTADAAETITMAGGTGVTLQGTLTIAQNSMNRFALFRTSSTTLVLRQA